MVLPIAGAFAHKAIAELLKLIPGLIEEVLLGRMFADQTLCHECKDGKLVRNGGTAWFPGRRDMLSQSVTALFYSLVVTSKDNGIGFEAWQLNALPWLATTTGQNIDTILPPRVDAAVVAGLMFNKRVVKCHP